VPFSASCAEGTRYSTSYPQYLFYTVICC